MEYSKNKLIMLFLNIMTSGRYSEKKEFVMSDYLIRYVVFNFISIVGCIILVIYTAYNLQRQMYLVAIVCAVMGLAALANFFLARKKIRQFIPSFIIMSFYCLFCGWIIWIRQSQGVNFLFIYVYPLLTIMMLGMRWGVILSATLMLITSAQMFLPGLSNYNYHINVSTRMLASYFLVFSTMIVIEISRRTKDDLIETQSLELKKFNKNLQRMVDERTQDIVDLQNAILKTIAELVERRDDITGSHIERTEKGIKFLIEELDKSGYYKEEIENWNIDLLLQSSKLHDVGKISITDSILKKPGKLTDAEFEEMKKHTVFGEEIISRIQALTKENDFLRYAQIFVSSHHEKWDGSGYPHNLKENDIPILGRIMAIVDVYDALTSVRQYKNALSHEEAIKIIMENSGTHFDPMLVKLFIKKAKT